MTAWQLVQIWPAVWAVCRKQRSQRRPRAGDRLIVTPCSRPETTESGSGRAPSGTTVTRDTGRISASGESAHGPRSGCSVCGRREQGLHSQKLRHGRGGEARGVGTRVPLRLQRLWQKGAGVTLTETPSGEGRGSAHEPRSGCSVCGSMEQRGYSHIHSVRGGEVRGGGRHTGPAPAAASVAVGSRGVTVTYTPSGEGRGG